MSSRRVGSASRLRGLNDVRHDAKIRVPPVRRGAVSRAALIESARSSRCRVIGVTAPAGYGKSTLLAEWARSESRRVGWLSLERFDDDPSILVELLASAHSRLEPGGGELIADVGGAGALVLGRAAPRLAAAFGTVSDPFVLLLDDLQELRSPECHDVLGMVISRIPKGSQIVTASRSEQPHLPRLRVAGDAVELVAGDLTLDSAAAQQVFANEHISLTGDAAAAVTDRTEGWAAGVYLSALIAKETGAAVTTVTGDDRYVADYLYREAFSHLPEAGQQFLRRASVLDQISAPICDAVLETDGAAHHLRVLENSNLFLVPLDRRREWYRFHSLFREFLLGELRRTEPELVERLHVRAADWFEGHGSPSTAIDHLLHTRERHRAAQAIADVALPTYNAGRISTLLRWLAALGDRTLEDCPPLAALAGWVCALTGDTAGAERWAGVVEAATFDGQPGGGGGSFDSARAILRGVMCANGPESMLADATFAVAQEPAWGRWRDTALWELGEARLLSGDVDGATAAFTESSRHAASIGNAASIISCESQLSLLSMERGDWDAAADHVGIALTTIDESHMHDYVPSLLAFAVAARLALHRGDADAARSQLARAMQSRESSTHAVPFIAVRLRLQLAGAHLAMSEPKTVRDLFREIDDILARRPALGRLLEEADDLRARASAASSRAGGSSPLTPAEQRLLPYLQTHLSFAQIGERLFVSRNTVATEVHAIYRKLGVTSRDDAVRRAARLGMLG